MTKDGQINWKKVQRVLDKIRKLNTDERMSLMKNLLEEKK